MMRNVDVIRNDLREELKRLKEYERRTDKIDKQYEENPSDETIEALWMNAYRKERSSFNTCALLIAELLGGKVDFKTASYMMRTGREKIERIVG